MLFCLLLPLQANEPSHIKAARGFIGIKEKAGNNDGKEIESWQAFVHLPKGSPYCAAFVSYCLWLSKAVEPGIRTGLATRFITKKSIRAIDVYKGKSKVPDYSIAVWRRGNSYKGHTGFVLKWQGTKGETIEANTSSDLKGNQRDGDGVYLRTREISPYSYFRITHFTRVSY